MLDGLSLDDVRRLDLLIKAHKFFAQKDPTSPSDKEVAEKLSTDDLLKDVKNGI